MPTITIGKTVKRINSTSNSFVTGSTIDLNCKMKNACSSNSPVIEVTITGNDGIGGSFYNYAKWGNWYYWIDDIIYITADIAELHLRLDPLATFKDAICDTYALASYADSSHWNEYVDDTRVNPEVRIGGNYSYKNIFPFTTSKDGLIVMTFAQTASLDWIDPNHTITTPCGIHTAILTWTDFRACIGDLTGFADTIPTNPSLIANIGDACLEIIQAFARSIESTGGGSLLSNIIRCVWLPFDYTNVITTLGLTSPNVGLTIGGLLSPNIVWYEIPQTAIYTHLEDYTLDIDSLTQNLKFLRNSRFTSVQVVTPAGYAQIPAEFLLDPYDTEYKIYIRTAINLVDGSWAVKFSKTSGRRDTIASFSGNLGVNMMGTIYDGPTTSSRIGQAITGLTQTALTMGVSSMIGGAVSGSMNTFKGYTSAGLKDYASHLGSREGMEQLTSGIQGSIPPTEFHAHASTGDYGGTASALFVNGDAGSCFICSECYAPLWLYNYPSEYEEFCDEYGYPCNDYVKIGDVSGYIKCVGASVVGATGATQQALSTINSYLNTGLYIE